METLRERIIVSTIFFGSLAAISFAIVYAAKFVASTIDDKRKHEEFWRGSSVVRICRDGTRIFKLKDGRYVTGVSYPQLVEDPDTVCAR